MLARVRAAPASGELLERRLVDVRRRLLEDYGLRLDRADLERIEYVHRAFFEAGLDLRFSTIGRPSLRYPTFEAILLETDLRGRYRNYLSSDALFERLRRFQQENRLIPIVGDFAGGHALQAAARLLEGKGLEVSVFYASNVEFYLFGTPGWAAWVDNVGAFPFTDDAVFIRSYFPSFGRRHPQNVPGHRPTSLIQPVRGFLDDAASGRLRSYWDLVAGHVD
jgi:hypothetical protein